MVFGYIMLVHLSLATVLTSLRRVNQAESSAVYSQFVLDIFFPCVWYPAIRNPDLLGSDLLFFTSPTYQPPASVSLGGGYKRNGWYFRGELLFPFLASIFYFNVWVSASCIAEPECGITTFNQVEDLIVVLFKHHSLVLIILLFSWLWENAWF